MILSELLLNLRRELSKAETEKAAAGFNAKFKVNKINLELYVDNIKEVNGSVNIKIVNLGGGVQTKNFHKINVELIPIKNKKLDHANLQINN